MSEFMKQCCILILLPIVPAVILFFGIKGAANAAGNIFGMKWSFGGAFAGYAFVLLLLTPIVRLQMFSKDAEVWTVRGRVDSIATSNIVNRVSIKSFPQTLSLDSSGNYEFKIIVGRKGDLFEFPKITVDLSLLCDDIKTIFLDEKTGTFSAIGNKKPIKIMKSLVTRSVEVEPIEVSLPVKGNECGATS